MIVKPVTRLPGLNGVHKRPDGGHDDAVQWPIVR